MKITFIGGGNMASAMIGGLLQKGFANTGMSVVEVSSVAREKLKTRYGVAVYADIAEGVADRDVIILAVKPQQLKEVASALKPCLQSQLVLSIAAGVRAADLSHWLGDYPKLVRAMPNTPAMILSGVTGLYALESVSDIEKDRADRIVQATGSVIWVADEALMDAVTAVSGSGPAYVFYFMEAMEEAAIGLGLSADTARKLALETFLGAARLAATSEEDIATLRARVTSKGGTTERALGEMEERAVKDSIIAAIRAAARRSRELGDELAR